MDRCRWMTGPELRRCRRERLAEVAGATLFTLLILVAGACALFAALRAR